MAFFLLLAGLVSSQSQYGAYFVNWAQYRAMPYTYTPTQLSPIITRLDQLLYGFVYFCPPAGTSPMPYWALPPYGTCNDNTEYQLMFVETKDPQFLQQINAYKSQRPGLKVMLSIGGWNFPSAYFSKMVSSSTNRQKFVSSALQFLQTYNVDGIDIDWEYPVSPPRVNPVEISCYDFQTVNDAGGSSADTTNFVTFLSDLRSGLGSKYLISVASQAAKQNEINMNIGQASQYVDWWHVMSYDYAVSDLPDATVMSPNCPLNTPTQAGTVQMSVSSTVNDYIAQGVPASKIMVGIPLYGHTWYQPNMINTNNWKTFGGTAAMQGMCCGPFQATYGAQPGKGAQQCGTMMFNEIQFAQPSYYYDTQTQSAIGFTNTMGADGYTQAGTWITYNDLYSVQNITQFANQKGLKGVFIFDASMDSVTASGQWTYQLMNGIANILGGH